MNSKSIYGIGLMSGTSLDGLDIVYVKFEDSMNYGFQIRSKSTIEYSSDWRNKLQYAINLSEIELEKLDIEYGQFLGEMVEQFIMENNISKLDFIASHGHTVFHEPYKGITKQIGSGEEIAKITKKQVVYDFRTQDVLLGGQGAPLVPIGDHILFSEYQACVNLGGFANISYIDKSDRIAFDICPVNVVLNHYANQMGLPFDEGGKNSKEGAVDIEVLQELNSLNYYLKKHPKSLGIEWVHEIIFPILSKIDSHKNVMRTFVEHCAIQIATSIENLPNVLFTGGGVYNDFLMERIGALSDTTIVKPNDSIIDYKEALIFAFLGLRRLENKINCLSSVTGAEYDHSSGKIFSFN